MARCTEYDCGSKLPMMGYEWRPRRRLLHHTILLIASGLVLASCVSVDPRADLEQARDAITRQTGAAEVYDPQAEGIIVERTQQLLQDGLSVDEAVQVALLNRRSFHAAFQEIGASRADVVQSQLISNPAVSLLFKFPEGGGRSRIEFGLAQELVDLWQIPVRRRIAEAQLQQTIAAVVLAGVELANETRTQYYRLLSLEAGEKVASESIAIAEKSVAFIETQHKAGEASQLDVNLAGAEVIDVRLELIAIEKDRTSARIDLARTIGLINADRNWPLTDDLPAPVQLPSLERLMTTARSERMDVQIASFELGQAEHELVQTYLQIFPSVSLGLAMERTERRAIPGRKILADTARESIANEAFTLPEIQSKAERDAERQGIIDLVMGPSFDVTLPIWDQNRAQIAKARFQVAKKRKEYEDVLEAVRHEVEQARTAAEQSARLIRFFEKDALPLAEQTARGARSLFERGEESLLVLLQSQKSLVSRRRAYIEGLGEYAATLAALEKAVGVRLASIPGALPIPVDDGGPASSQPSPPQERTRLGPASRPAIHAVSSQGIRQIMQKMRYCTPAEQTDKPQERERQLEEIRSLARDMAGSAAALPATVNDLELSPQEKQVFLDLAKTFSDEATALSQISHSDIPPVERQINRVHSTCNACHVLFRAEK